MPRHSTPSQPETARIGWRLKQLRRRRGLTQTGLSGLTGLHTSYISRIESGRDVHPKPQTVEKILAGLGATPQERNAVFHVEEPELTREEITACVAEVMSVEEDNPMPAVLLDHRWRRWYLNSSARAALGITRDLYRNTIGEPVLVSLVNPDSEMYNLFLEELRNNDFASRLAAFRRQFAGQEFDSWYLHTLSTISAFPGARETIEHPPPGAQPRFIELLEVTLKNPIVGDLRLRSQMNRLAIDPRFTIAHLTPRDA